ncbi:MAG: hypothetical protein WD426_20085 [Anditalea sp.]
MYITGEEAVKAIQSYTRIFLHGSAATPHHLIEKMVERAAELRQVEIISVSTMGQHRR